MTEQVKEPKAQQLNNQGKSKDHQQENQQDCQSRNQKLQQIIKECEEEISAMAQTAESCMQEIYRNAKVGMSSIEILRPFSEDKGFRNLLMRQYSEYNGLAKEMEIYCANHNIELKSNSMFSKIMMFITTAINTLKDKSNSKLSEIMIQGINMGIISITKVQNHLSDTNSHNHFADKMMMLLQQNLEDLKLFL
ncbi:MAG: hypothetical protein GX242_05520 [Clostridiales bacterium]|nr:hypothetical protein [Clostridiales bacterium]